MVILTLRTDKPDAEIGIYRDKNQLSYHVWLAHRQLAETIHLEISEALKQQTLTPSDVTGIIFYKGPGSFTGLRIGASLVNAWGSAAKNIAIVSQNGDNWVNDGIKRLFEGADELALPDYGAPPKTTVPKK